MVESKFILEWFLERSYLVPKVWYTIGVGCVWRERKEREEPAKETWEVVPNVIRSWLQVTELGDILIRVKQTNNPITLEPVSKGCASSSVDGPQAAASWLIQLATLDVLRPQSEGVDDGAASLRGIQVNSMSVRYCFYFVSLFCFLHTPSVWDLLFKLKSIWNKKLLLAADLNKTQERISWFFVWNIVFKSTFHFKVDLWICSLWLLV